jgi:hypothetical protein
MKKDNLNFLIDVVAFVAFVLLTATGVLVHYILPPGSGRFTILWGMDRHAWGQLHFWIAVVLMASLGLHLLLHWKWIVHKVKGRPNEESGIRVALSVVGLIALVALAATPFFGKVEQTTGEPPHKMRSTELRGSKDYKIDGSMTLKDVEKLTGVPGAVILKELGLPNHLSMDESLGRLRNDYGFELNDVREVVQRQAEKK